MDSNKRSIRLNFAPDLVPLVLKKEKFITWRINDEKGFKPGDELTLWLKGKDKNGDVVEASKPFGKGKVLEVWEKTFKEFGDKERNGHEAFLNDEEMVNQYKKYYGDWVSFDTKVKIIKFELISSL